MSYKVWVQRLPFNPSRKIRWGLAVSLTFGLQFGAGMRESPAIADSRYPSTPAQGRSGVTARRIFDEGETLQDQGTAESLRLAVKKYEEALSLWRAIGDRRSEAKTLNNIGLVYYSLGDNQKALDFHTAELMTMFYRRVLVEGERPAAALRAAQVES